MGVALFDGQCECGGSEPVARYTVGDVGESEPEPGECWTGTGGADTADLSGVVAVAGGDVL